MQGLFSPGNLHGFSPRMPAAHSLGLVVLPLLIQKPRYPGSAVGRKGLPSANMCLVDAVSHGQKSREHILRFSGPWVK